MFRVERRIIDELWPASELSTSKAKLPLRPKGNPGTGKTKRIIAAMSEMDRTELGDMTHKAMEHQFGAAPSTCKKARDTVLGMTFDK